MCIWIVKSLVDDRIFSGGFSCHNSKNLGLCKRLCYSYGKKMMILNKEFWTNLMNGTYLIVWFIWKPCELKQIQKFFIIWGMGDSPHQPKNDQTKYLQSIVSLPPNLHFLLIKAVVSLIVAWNGTLKSKKENLLKF